MGESIVQVTSGAGPKLHTWQYTVGANSVEDGFTIPGPNPYPTYFALGEAVSIATANDHIMCLNAGASLKVRVLRIRIEQVANATAATVSRFQLYRTTTAAPTGGTAVTPNPLETSDAAAGAAGRTLPTAKGTEATLLQSTAMVWRQAVGTTTAQVDDAWEWTPSPWGKPLIIPAGTTNGLAIKNFSAVAGATVNVLFEFIETAF
jgi:hypothetical protein